MFRIPMILLVSLFGFLTITGLAQTDSEDSSEKEGVSISEEMVVSASRKAEKKLEAPSTIETFTDEDILLSSSTTFSGAAANMKGVDFANGGLALQKISARGFSSSYSSRMLSMVDGRLATLPGAGLPQGNLGTVSSLDIKTIEVVLGPASALYGANASAGVFNVITKNPWDEEGLAVNLKGGEQSLFDAQLRYAGISSDGRWGWKVTGQFMEGDEFDSDNIFFANGQNQTLYTSTLSESEAQAAINAEFAAGTAFRERDLTSFDVSSKKYEVNGYYRNDAILASVTYGWAENDSFGTTNLGRNRIQGWEVEYYNAEITAPHFYFQYTKTENFAGETYSIQNVPGGLVAGVPFEDVISSPALAGFFDASAMEDVEVQTNWSFGDLDLVAGVSYRNYEPDSGATYLDDFRDENGNVIRDISKEETGAYLQLDYRTMEEKLRFTGAVRYDDSSEYDAETSPKFAVTYTPNSNHSIRLNHNRAHRDPAIIENHLFFFGGIARGNLNGYTVRDAEGNETAFPSLVPEIVDTTEVGYRGVWGGSFVFDGVVYSSKYENFISPLQTIAHPAFGTVAIDNATGEEIPFLLTYLNYGEADVEGLDLGLDYYYGSKFNMSVSYGYQNLKSFTNPTNIPDLPFNTPKNKYKASFNFFDIGLDNTFASLQARHTDEYAYSSGRWNGVIQANTIADMALGYKWKDQDMVFKLSVSNLFDSDKTELIGVPAIPRKRPGVSGLFLFGNQLRKDALFEWCLQFLASDPTRVSRCLSRCRAPHNRSCCRWPGIGKVR